MSTTIKDIRALFAQLTKAKSYPFPKVRGHITEVPDGPGVYVIYPPRSKRVLHVGKTSRRTLRQRLKSHCMVTQTFRVVSLEGVMSFNA